MAGSVTCNYCKTQIEIADGYSRPFIPCPQCKRMVTVSGSASPRPAGPPPVRPAQQPPVPSAPPRLPQHPPVPSSPRPPAPPPLPSAMTGEPGEALPELMKANKRVAGKPCGICSKPLNLGEQIHNCPKCRSANHDACWSMAGGCKSPMCITSSGQSAPAMHGGASGFGGPGGAMPGSMVPGAPPPPPGGTVPCRWCKEPIARGARKCKHCNEYQSDEDRATQSKQGQAALAGDDAALSTTDWIGVVCCPLIGIIQGLVYVSQGNPKGSKLILYSIISIGIGSVIRAAGGGH